MAHPRARFLIVTVALLGVGGLLVWGIHQRLQDGAKTAVLRAGKQVVPVEVVAIEHGPIDWLRTFTGTLEARAEFVVAPKVGGRLERLNADLADEVTRGQVVAVLDDAETVQAVARARADLEVARASRAEARSLLEIAERELKRIEQLRERGVISESQRDAAKAEELAKLAAMEVTKAQVARAEAELEAARIRLGYTQVAAGWRGGGDRRVVAERYVDEGETVAANAPLLRIVELDPITGVFFVTEREYGRLRHGQDVMISTDAFPGETFQGVVQRIAPVFRESTRQARVELRVSNRELRLKPGMFVRATVLLGREAEAVIVPEQALTTRDGRKGVFVVDPQGTSVTWREVRPGIRQGDRVQIQGEGLEGKVVVLSQQMLEDGASIRISGERTVTAP